MKYIVNLPMDQWHTCTRCGGKAELVLTEDLHRSAGLIPCTYCSGGTVKQETISQEEYDRRLRAQRPAGFDLDPIHRQNAEFAALTELSKAWVTLQRIAVVDDDYPEYRHRYEGRVNAFLRACKENGRTI